jgi:hypothetical protein
MSRCLVVLPRPGMVMGAVLVDGPAAGCPTGPGPSVHMIMLQLRGVHIAVVVDYRCQQTTPRCPPVRTLGVRRPRRPMLGDQRRRAGAECASAHTVLGRRRREAPARPAAVHRGHRSSRAGSGRLRNQTPRQRRLSAAASGRGRVSGRLLATADPAARVTGSRRRPVSADGVPQLPGRLAELVGESVPEPCSRQGPGRPLQCQGVLGGQPPVPRSAPRTAGR